MFTKYLIEKYMMQGDKPAAAGEEQTRIKAHPITFNLRITSHFVQSGK